MQRRKHFLAHTESESGDSPKRRGKVDNGFAGSADLYEYGNRTKFYGDAIRRRTDVGGDGQRASRDRIGFRK
jgi:hypothetical protein